MKNIKKKALLLSSIAALAILTGCGNSNKVVSIEGEQYVKSGEEYTKLEIAPRIYEPGEHKITYSAYFGAFTFKEWERSVYSYAPETPEGYELEDFKIVENSNVIFVYVNTKRVEANGYYDVKLNKVTYNTPGKVVQEKVLEMGD